VMLDRRGERRCVVIGQGAVESLNGTMRGALRLSEAMG
jgi:hypothetical protein